MRGSAICYKLCSAARRNLCTCFHQLSSLHVYDAASMAWHTTWTFFRNSEMIRYVLMNANRDKVELLLSDWYRISEADTNTGFREDSADHGCGCHYIRYWAGMKTDLFLCRLCADFTLVWVCKGTVKFAFFNKYQLTLNQRILKWNIPK